MVASLCFDWQEYIRRQLEEEQRHLEMLQEQLLREQAMLLVSHTQTLHTASNMLLLQIIPDVLLKDWFQ